jgi:membrane protein required for colicin V production
MEPWVFDVIVVAVILLSAIMSLGRGLIREAFSVISFIIGGLVAYYALVFLEKPLAGVLPDGWPDMLPAAILVVVGFLAAYMAAAFLGGRLSRLIHSSPEIGVLDRLAGAVFGAARGLLAMILFVLLVRQALSGEPDYISKSTSYAVLNPAATWIQTTVPGFMKGMGDAVKGDEPAEPAPEAAPTPAPPANGG